MSIQTYFHRMLKKLFRSSSNHKEDGELSINNNVIINNIHTLSIVLHPNDNVDIIMMHPNLENLSLTEIAFEAEKFAELLVYITNPLVEPKLLTTITNKTKKKDTTTKEHLFYDNVITYYRLVKAEFEKNLGDNGPVVRPRAAFSLK